MKLIPRYVHTDIKVGNNNSIIGITTFDNIRTNYIFPNLISIKSCHLYTTLRALETSEINRNIPYHITIIDSRIVNEISNPYDTDQTSKHKAKRKRIGK